MTFGLDTDSFLNAFARMVSDRGTNFISPNRELKELVWKLDKNNIFQRTANQGVLNNPPRAPHYGGANEIMIKATKRPSMQFLEKQKSLTHNLSSIQDR